MHELSLMQSVLESIAPVARENGATKVTAVTLSIGDMTEVVDEAMSFAFEALTEDDPFFSGAELTMNFIKPRSQCLDCGHEFEHDRFHMACPECDSLATRLLAGRDLHIASIEVDIPEDDEEKQNDPD